MKESEDKVKDLEQLMGGRKFSKSLRKSHGKRVRSYFNVGFF